MNFPNAMCTTQCVCVCACVYRVKNKRKKFISVGAHFRVSAACSFSLRIFFFLYFVFIYICFLSFFRCIIYLYRRCVVAKMYLRMLSRTTVCRVSSARVRCLVLSRMDVADAPLAVSLQFIRFYRVFFVSIGWRSSVTHNSELVIVSFDFHLLFDCIRSRVVRISLASYRVNWCTSSCFNCFRFNWPIYCSSLFDSGQIAIELCCSVAPMCDKCYNFFFLSLRWLSSLPVAVCVCTSV